MIKKLLYYSYPIMSIMGVGLLFFILFRTNSNFTLVDGAVIGFVVLVVLGLWRLLVTEQTEGVDTLTIFESQIKNGQRPTVIEFYSRYCAGCIAMKPVVDRLAQDAGDRLQIIRLNIEEEPGKTLMEQHNVVFTPTFLYFDAEGKKLRESVGVLDRARILYEMEQA